MSVCPATVGYIITGIIMVPYLIFCILSIVLHMVKENQKLEEKELPLQKPPFVETVNFMSNRLWYVPKGWKTSPSAEMNTLEKSPVIEPSLQKLDSFESVPIYATSDAWVVDSTSKSTLEKSPVIEKKQDSYESVPLYVATGDWIVNRKAKKSSEKPPVIQEKRDSFESASSSSDDGTDDLTSKVPTEERVEESDTVVERDLTDIYFNLSAEEAKSPSVRNHEPFNWL